MQDYTPLGSTATTTVKDGILNHEKNINALRSTYSGTAFPTENLVAGLKCYRTDLGKTYTYNGETWDDSVNTSSLTVSGETSVPTPSTENNSKTIANTEFVHGVISDLVNGAPTALDTLQELASALGNDPNFATTVLNKIGEKESKTDAQIEHKRLQDAIPTKVSQLSNDSGYQKTAEIPIASQTQNGYMSKDDKAKLDGIVDMFYPVGTVYATTASKKPEFMNYGTWEQFAQGRTLVGAGKGMDSNNLAMTFNTGDSGGEYKHQLTVREMPAHRISFPIGDYDGWDIGSSDIGQYVFYFRNSLNPGGNIYTGHLNLNPSNSIGNDEKHNNIQPYTVVYYYRRIS